jgi:hypothetical protein
MSAPILLGLLSGLVAGVFFGGSNTRHAAPGTHVDTVVIEASNVSSPAPFATYTFGTVFVSACRVRPSTESVSESVWFEFGQNHPSIQPIASSR